MEYRYRVGMIDGDYAHLYRTDDGSNDEITVAMALLPEDITEGCELLWKDLQYSIIPNSL